MPEIEQKLRAKLDAFYDHIDAQPVSTNLRRFVASDVPQRKRLLQPLLAGAAGLVAAGAIVLVGITVHTGSGNGPPKGPAGIETGTPLPVPTATSVTMLPSTPNPAFPGTQITLSGARTGTLDVTALRCQSKNQSGDTVVEGTNNGNNVTLQLLNPSVFPSAGTSVYGGAPQGFVSFSDSGTIPRNQASPNAAGWSADTPDGVTYAANTITMNVDLSAKNSYASGTVHVAGTIACPSS